MLKTFAAFVLAATVFAVALTSAPRAAGLDPGGAILRPPPDPPGVRLVRRSGPSDTLVYGFSWGAGTGATGYQLRVYPIRFSATVPASVGWTTVPKTMPISTVGLSTSIALINPVWDSARFRVVIRSTRPAAPGASSPIVVSKDSTVAEWTVVRLGAPGPIIVDSSLIIVGLRVVRVPVPFDTLSDAFCPIVLFYGGGEAMRASDAGGPCLEVASRLEGVTPAQQARADTVRLRARNSRAYASIGWTP